MPAFTALLPRDFMLPADGSGSGGVVGFPGLVGRGLLAPALWLMLAGWGGSPRGWLQFAATGKYVGGRTTDVRDVVEKGTWAALHNSQLPPPPHAALATNVTTTGTTSPLVPFREAS